MRLRLEPESSVRRLQSECLHLAQIARNLKSVEPRQVDAPKVILANGTVLVDIEQHRHSGPSGWRVWLVVVPIYVSREKSPDSFTPAELLYGSDVRFAAAAYRLKAHRRVRQAAESSAGTTYVAAELLPEAEDGSAEQSSTIALGDGRQYGNFVNKPLQRDTSYQCFLQSVFAEKENPGVRLFATFASGQVAVAN